MSIATAIRWEDGELVLLDQRLLPTSVTYEKQTDLAMVVDAIKMLKVRGAPAIGITAAYGMVIAARAGVALEDAAAALRAARPTAVNLAWAVERMLRAGPDINALTLEAETIHAEDRRICRSIGEHGAALITPGAGVLTHCNAGALAVSEFGTATAPMYKAHSDGVAFRVYADETRPVLQGARLTAWELDQAGIDVTLICDGMAAHLMAEGAIDLVIVGTDRVTANGDVVNKIGTRGLAIVAAYHSVPFYVALPSPTYDARTPTGGDVVIEEREPWEVTESIPSVPGIAVRNPAFDVTPRDLVTAYVTERGVIRDVSLLGGE